MAQGTRRTPEDVDINRTFADGHGAPEETQLVGAAISTVKPGLALDLHSGKAARDGFWLIHQGGADIAADAMKRFQKRWPALKSDPAPYVLASPGVSESGNEGTLKGAAVAAGARAAVTIEAPGSVSYVDQVLGENELVHALIEAELART
jgi:predicted deacylase